MRNQPVSKIDDPITRLILSVKPIYSKMLRKYILFLVSLVIDKIKATIPTFLVSCLMVEVRIMCIWLPFFAFMSLTASTMEYSLPAHHCSRRVIWARINTSHFCLSSYQFTASQLKMSHASLEITAQFIKVFQYCCANQTSDAMPISSIWQWNSGLKNSPTSLMRCFAWVNLWGSSELLNILCACQIWHTLVLFNQKNTLVWEIW